jgi:hypothetical protein
MLHSHLRLREDRGLLALGPCLSLPSPRRPPINALHITAVGITSPAANISSNTLTAFSIRPLLHHQRSPWRSQGRRHRVPASRAEAPLRTTGPCVGARRRLLQPCHIAHAHTRTARVLGPHGAAAHASESALRATTCSGLFSSARVLLLRSHAYAACICAVLAPAAQHLHTLPASARHYVHARATRSAPPTFLPLQHLHRLSSTRAPASPKPCRSRSRARLTPVPAHACSRVARAHSELQTHAYPGPVLLLHLCAPRCTPPAPASRPSQAARQRLLHASHAPCTGAAYAAPTHARVHAPATPESSCVGLLLRSAWPARSTLTHAPGPPPFACATRASGPASAEPSQPHATNAPSPAARTRSLPRASARRVCSILAASPPSAPCSWARLRRASPHARPPGAARQPRAAAPPAAGRLSRARLRASAPSRAASRAALQLLQPALAPAAAAPSSWIPSTCERKAPWCPCAEPVEEERERGKKMDKEETVLLMGRKRKAPGKGKLRRRSETLPRTCAQI